MNRLVLVILLLFVFCSHSLWAKKIDPEKAKDVVTNFVQSKEQLRSATDASVKLVYTACEHSSSLKSSGAQDVVYYYIFNVGDNNGFVIVSGDDIATPILGYSNSGSYDSNNLPPNFKYWMDYLKSGIGYAINENLVADAKTKAEWSTYFTNNTSILRSSQAVSPLIETAWDQDSPYNDLCPSVGAQKTVTGCVATAMAQVMKYYNYPVAGTGSKGYTTNTRGIVISPVNFAAGYDWNSMTNTYSASSTTTAKTAVATLMYHCGVSVDMDYDISSAGGSGASDMAPGKALITYFGYDQSIQFKQRIFYTDNEWHNILKQEINARRPVLYSGINPTSGHSFICDGYDDLGKFHFNWGWGGYLDGYFVSNALNPGTGGAGSGAGTYNEGQTITINIKPNAGGAKTHEMKVMAGTSVSSLAPTVYKGEYFTASATFQNAGITDFTGKYGFVLVDNDDNIVEPLGIYNSEDWPLNAGYFYVDPFPIACKTSSTMAPGNYKIRAAVLPSGGNWTAIKGQIGYIDILNLEVKDKVITHAIVLQSTTNLTSSVTEIFNNEDFIVSARFWNIGSNEFVGKYGIVLVDDNDNILETIGIYNSSDMTLPGGYSYNNPFSINCKISSSIVPGTYKIRAAALPSGGEWCIIKQQIKQGQIDILDITVKENVSNSINNVDLKSLTIYPNPVKDILHISNEDIAIQSVKIMDLSGRLLKTVSLSELNTQVEIPVGELFAGTYFVIIQTEQGTVTRKIIKI